MEDVLAAVAGALTAGTADAVAAGAKSAVAGLVRLVRERFGRGTREGAVLQAAMNRPDDPDRQALLVRTLVEIAMTDAVFERRIRDYWEAHATQIRAEDRSVNQFSGRAGKLVQARDVYGDVSL